MKISVLIPSIRTNNWNQVLSTLAQSCKRYDYEVVFAGPFEPTEKLDKVKFIKTYACPSVAGQLGATLCTGDLIYHSVDDAKFVPDAIDLATDLYINKCGRKDVVNMRYTEDDDYTGKTFPLDFWFAHYHPPLRLAGIPNNYKLALHFLINREYFMEIGGFDCSWEYMNFNLHDLMFRIQDDGGIIHDSPTDATNCNHYGIGKGDHKAIEDAYPSDHALFIKKYSQRNVAIKIPFDNYKQQPDIWTRRFKKMYKTYEEMIADKESK